MRMVKCPMCRGTGEYVLIQRWEGKEFGTPVKCQCNNGKISWSEFCWKYRRLARRRGGLKKVCR